MIYDRISGKTVNVQGLPNRLVNTKEASEFSGLSTWELLRGYKAGEYPAIRIGRCEGSRLRLRWDLELLGEAIRRKMEKGMIA